MDAYDRWPADKLKRCPMCEAVKDKRDFYRNRVNGLSTYCKPCSAERKRMGPHSRADLREQVYPTDKTKVCSKCREEKHRSEFNSRIHGGRQTMRSLCRDCQAARFKEWALATGRQTLGSREDVRAAKRAVTYPSDGVKLCRGCDRLLDKDAFGWRFRVGGVCKECRAGQDRARRASNLDAHRAYAKNYRKNNLEAVRKLAREGARRRNANLKAARSESRVSAKDKLKLVARYGYKCMCCGSEEGITFDHVLPISKGGPDVVDNIQLLCGPCNSSKHTKVIDYRPESASPNQ